MRAKLEIYRLSEKAQPVGPGLTMQRFHKALIDASAPAWASIGTAVDAE